MDGALFGKHNPISSIVEQTYDVLLVDVVPHKRMSVIDTLMKANLGREITFTDAMIMTFQLPSPLIQSVSLTKAVTLEMIFEVYGGTVAIRPSRAKHYGTG